MNHNLTVSESRSLAYLFVHEFQNDTHVALDWNAREQMEMITSNVIWGNYKINVETFERRLNAMIIVAELSGYPDEIASDIKRIRKRIWDYLSKAREEYYE